VIAQCTAIPLSVLPSQTRAGTPFISITLLVFSIVILMPQVSYLVRQQVVARLSNPTTGFNFWLAAACATQTPAPTPFVIDWTASSTNFWQSNISAEALDESSPDEGTLCMVYGEGFRNQTGTVQKFAVFSGTLEIEVCFELGWPQSNAPNDTEGLADATDDAMIQTFNSAAYFGAFSNGVIYNGLIDGGRGPLRPSGEGWRQRLPYRLTFELVA
jgi:hypothetical protein